MITLQATTNRFALLSFLVAALTLVLFCIGFIPIPFTAWLCYPFAGLLGLLAVLLGLFSLRQLRNSLQNGRTMAMIGIWVGGLTILAIICLTSLTVYFIFFGVDTIKNLWLQLNP